MDTLRYNWRRKSIGWTLRRYYKSDKCVGECMVGCGRDI